MKKRTFAATALLLAMFFCGKAAAQEGFSFRVAPALAVPAGLENLKLGFGGTANLGWGFWSRGRFALGAYAGGGFALLGVKDGTTLTIGEGFLGPYFDYRAIDRLSLRLGLDAGVYRYSWEGDGGTKFRAGGSLSAAVHLTSIFSVYAEAGYGYYVLGSRPLHKIAAAVGLQLNLSELLKPQARVAAAVADPKRIFPVSYEWYAPGAAAGNEIATARLVNNEKNAITDVTLSFWMERYMNAPTAFAQVPRLKAGESAALPVSALFNEGMLDLKESTLANAVLIVDYRSLGTKKRAEFPAPQTVYHRNAMSWDDDRRAASFVSARDPAAVYFARNVEAQVRGSLSAARPRETQLAQALFETLAQYGINYVVDPASSFAALSEDASALDSLNYPYETLYYRGGDCDDLSILFCSLLEVLEVETAFITIPGHIYCAYAVSGGGEQGGTVDAAGRKWVPVEVTIPQKGFAEARRVGLRQWNDAAPDARALYPMRESWKLFPPVSVPGAGDSLPDMPE